MSSPTKRLKIGDKVNRLVSEYSAEEEKEYYNQDYEDRIYSRFCEKNGVDFIFPSSGTDNLRIVTRHDMVNVVDNVVLEKIVGGGHVGVGNESVLRGSPRSLLDMEDSDIVIEAGMIFFIEGAKEVLPYANYDITWQVVESTSNCVKCEILHPPGALNCLPKLRDFTDVDTVARIIKSSN